MDTRKGEQHSAAYLVNNPNAKKQVLLDGAATVLDSNAFFLRLVVAWWLWRHRFLSKIGL